MLYETVWASKRSYYPIFTSLQGVSSPHGLGLTWIWDVSLSFPVAQPFLAKFPLPMQNRADSGTPKIKVNPTKFHELIEHPVIVLSSALLTNSMILILPGHVRVNISYLSSTVTGILNFFFTHTLHSHKDYHRKMYCILGFVGRPSVTYSGVPYRIIFSILMPF